MSLLVFSPKCPKGFEPIQARAAGIDSIHHLLSYGDHLTAGGIYTIDEMMVPVSRIFELKGVPEMKEKEKKYSL